MSKKVVPAAGKAAVSAWISAVSPLLSGVGEGGDSPASVPRIPPGLIGQFLSGADASTSPSQAPGREGPNLPRETCATAVRYTLQLLGESAPGHAVEVRVPPFGAVQILTGTTHRRGTPPAVVEMPPAVWLALACGFITWDAAAELKEVSASGQRANLKALLPLDMGLNSC